MAQAPPSATASGGRAPSRTVTRPRKLFGRLRAAAFGPIERTGSDLTILVLGGNLGITAGHGGLGNFPRRGACRSRSVGIVLELG